ncbi:hypothetical protein [Streptomyces johnsoniae]|uniref:Protein kilB n=1 Tax=Streptomyces johnsoniae TaxID=3075532 RepID=A0ABU2S427_9ACTN|nr:hypothetical protein [Streptomyces sp. DSM 41886]MDT0443446.1 hypothetical protein [Streptomyces sp. DSM 41886]
MIGTLLGALTTRLLQRWMSSRAERVVRTQRLQEAASSLADALTDYRGQLYWETRLAAQSEAVAEQKEEALRESWAARSRVNYAINRLRLATQNERILQLATDARNATFGVQTGACAPHDARERQFAFLAAVAGASQI